MNQGTIHWVSAPHALDAEVILFTVEQPDAPTEDGAGDFTQYLNPASLETVTAN